METLSRPINFKLIKSLIKYYLLFSVFLTIFYMVYMNFLSDDGKRLIKIKVLEENKNNAQIPEFRFSHTQQTKSQTTQQFAFQTGAQIQSVPLILPVQKKLTQKSISELKSVSNKKQEASKKPKPPLERKTNVQNPLLLSSPITELRVDVNNENPSDSSLRTRQMFQ